MAWLGRRALLGVLVGATVMLGQTMTSAAGPPAPIWNGVYIGLHGGHANADLGYTLDLSFAADAKLNHTPSGWYGGGHIGAQRQWGRIVAGIEAGYSALDLSDTAASKGSLRQIDVDGLFTLGLRLGYAFDRWLPYVKAGYASAKVDTLVPKGSGSGAATSGHENGWFVGAGVEFLRGRGLVLGLEYNYVRLDLDERSGLLDYCKQFTYKDFDADIHTISARLSYKFGHDEYKPLK
jgi:opacity protein-like surface antigen